jgi:AraC-like DNA-binding protein
VNTGHHSELFQVADILGLDFEPGLKESFLKEVDYTVFKIHNYFPDLIVGIRSIITKGEIQFKRTGIKEMEGLMISFHNFFDDGFESSSLVEDKPSVSITPLHFASEFQLPVNAHRKQLLLLVSTSFLRGYLGGEKDRFDFLFKKESHFFMEETMTLEILEVVTQITRVKTERKLPDYYFKLKAMELIYHLFTTLSKRNISGHQNINAVELKAVYLVKEILLSKLDSPAPIKSLVAKAAMNEQKLRKLFTQVFGMGIYNYFQHHRMLEAARLLKVEKRTVSDVGYQLGFSNISHFGRVFEEHFGMKPKKYSTVNSL